PLLSRHPYDLSGGEMQKAALAKLLLLSPDILLLDEPDRGLDAASKEEVITLLRKLRSEGKTILFVSHDLNFTARVADRVSLLFNGQIVVTENSRSFFSENNFYTTDVARVTRGILPGLVALEDLDAKRFD
ncbi:MAG: AAA family ATPase, partial [Eubacteriales bacterium]|nr:AAA family ATPase [Eubacteriales bacterium]